MHDALLALAFRQVNKASDGPSIVVRTVAVGDQHFRFSRCAAPQLERKVFTDTGPIGKPREDFRYFHAGAPQALLQDSGEHWVSQSSRRHDKRPAPCLNRDDAEQKALRRTTGAPAATWAR